MGKREQIREREQGRKREIKEKEKAYTYFLPRVNKRRKDMEIEKDRKQYYNERKEGRRKTVKRESEEEEVTVWNGENEITTDKPKEKDSK